MRTFFLIPVVCLALIGCATKSKDLRAVWMHPTLPPSDFPAPMNFTVTPAEVISIVRKSRALSLKHVWHVYADSSYYYVHDTFLGDSPGRAFTQGVRVDGRTGEIVRR